MSLTEKQQAYCDRVEANLKGLCAVSTGACPGCDECADAFGFDSTDEFTEAYESGSFEPESSFCWSGCEICGSSLGGEMEHWHAIEGDKPKGGEILHFTNACRDCLMFLANGEVPDDEYLD